MMKYFDVKEKLPPIGEMVKVFWELFAWGGHGIWHKGIRISETHFEVGENEKMLIWIDVSSRLCLGMGITHWANLDETNLPCLCRLHDGGKCE